jgi:hypothetical protein
MAAYRRHKADFYRELAARYGPDRPPEERREGVERLRKALQLIRPEERSMEVRIIGVGDEVKYVRFDG